MNERRSAPRYSLRLRVYFPGQNVFGHTSDISLYGCYVETDASLAEGNVMDILLELPLIGPIPLKVYIQHTKSKTAKKTGAGMQFVQVRFAPNESEYFNIYQQFIKLIPQIEKIRDRYMDIVKKGELKLHFMPQKDAHDKKDN
ncbi:MAG: PilZ domain-containing protein [Dissulfurimicrobium sp.]